MKTILKNYTEKLLINYTILPANIELLIFQKGKLLFVRLDFLIIYQKKYLESLKRKNYLKDYTDGSKEKFAYKIAFYMCELIALHPFYELNGRTIRLFFDMIATYNGYEYIDYQDTLEIIDGDNAFIKASIGCMSGNDNKMYKIIFNGLNKSE